MSPKQKILYKFSRNFIRLYALLLLRMDIQWQAPLPDGPVLIAANHPSTSDPFYIMTVSRRPVSILMIESPFRIPVFGSLLHHAGHIPVLHADRRSAFDAAHQKLRSGSSVAIFPEGDTSPQQGGFLPPRSGVARLALLTGVPVVPVGIYLNRERALTIRSRIAGRKTVGYWHLKGPYGITVGPAKKFEGDVNDREHVRSIGRNIMENIITLAHLSQHRVEAVS